MKLLSQKVFLEKFNISEDEFTKTGLSWGILDSIFNDYQEFRKTLEPPALYIFNSIAKCPKVHSVRFRVKDAEHTVEKIIRKRIEEPDRVIDLTNYKTELTDLIGVRAIHLYKNDWTFIHQFIMEKWALIKKPVANFRKGDSEQYLQEFIEKGCETKEHKYGYRSVHYIIETQPDKNKYFAELQVRTIFEEGWSEIDHDVRYPYDLDNVLFASFLSIFNRLSGSADEMGTYIKYLQREIKRIEKENKTKLLEKETYIKEVVSEMEKIKIEKTQKDIMIQKLKKLNETSQTITIPKLTMPDISSIQKGQKPLYDLMKDMEKIRELLKKK